MVLKAIHFLRSLFVSCDPCEILDPPPGLTNLVPPGRLKILDRQTTGCQDVPPFGYFSTFTLLCTNFPVLQATSMVLDRYLENLLRRGDRLKFLPGQRLFRHLHQENDAGRILQLAWTQKCIKR